MTEFRRALKLVRRLLPGYKPTITKLWIEVTDKCNSRCTNCNIWKQESTDNPLTPQEINHILHDAIFKDVDYIINSGGEPTTRQDLYEFLEAEHLALPNATIQLSTNGLKPRIVVGIVDRLLKNHPDLKMEIGTSIDGIGSDHDSVRGVKGNWILVNDLLDQLIELRKIYGRKRLSIGFGTVVTDRTIDRIPAIRHYADEKGVGCLLQWYNQSGFYSNEERSKETETTNEDRTKQTCSLLKEADYTILSDLWCNYLEGKPYKFNCMALRSFCVIKCNGDIVPCLSEWDYVIGNVRYETPSEIFEGIKVFPNEGCEGCLNSWATYWSFEADPIQYVRYFLKHPIKLVKKLCG